jgi:hypothetical protein
MKKILIIALIISQLFISCANNSETILKILKIGSLENYTVLNAVWLDRNSIIIMAGKYYIPFDKIGIPHSENINWSTTMFEFYRYTLNDDKIEKIFEYPMVGEPFFIYLKILNDGTLAFKTMQKIVRYSIDQKKIIFEYNYPFKDFELSLIDISPDGEKIAYFNNKDGARAIIEFPGARKKAEKILVKGVEFLNYPIWSADSRFILAYSPTIGDVVNATTIIDTQNKMFKVNKFNNKYSDSARVHWGNDTGTYIKYDVLGSGLITLEKYNVSSGNSERITGLPKPIENVRVSSHQIDSNKSVVVLSSIDSSNIGKPDGKGITSFIAYNYKTGKQCVSEKFIGYSPWLLPVISPTENTALVFFSKITKSQDEFPPWSIAVFDFSRIYK